MTPAPKRDLVRDLVLELFGTRCQCGDDKTTRQTFCRQCYYRLPAPLRRALYREMGEGYEEAYARAIQHLSR